MKLKLTIKIGQEIHIEKIELEKLAKVPKSKTLHIGRGVKTITVEQMKNPRPRRSTEGMTRITK